MNDDAVPSSSRTPPTLDETPLGAVLDENGEGKVQNHLQLEKRIAFLDQLILNLDMMIYLQFSVLYYMK